MVILIPTAAVFKSTAYTYAVYSNIIKTAQDFRNTDKWLYSLIYIYMSEPFHCGGTLDGTPFYSSSDYLFWAKLE